MLLSPTTNASSNCPKPGKCPKAIGASPPGVFKHVAALAGMGSAEIPVDVIRNPNWHFLRCEYYDRYYGNAHLDCPPRCALLPARP